MGVAVHTNLYSQRNYPVGHRSSLSHTPLLPVQLFYFLNHRD